jgi:hypothetical protein
MKMTATRRRTASGVTLVELMIVMTVTSIIVLVISTLLVAGQKQWARTYAYANTSIEADAVGTILAYGSFGRRGNKNNYVVYKLVNGNYTVSLPPVGDPTSIVNGDAVEFRYWDTDFDGSMLDPAKTATAYAFFYLNGRNLRLDQGTYDSATNVGAVQGGLRVTGSQVKTTVLSTRVTGLVFSHDTISASGAGDGSVRMAITFTDPVTNDTLSIKAATLQRNVWP